jgi:cytochrome c oxidase subunit III
VTGRYLDVSGLPAYDISNKSPLWWGQLLLSFIEGTMFVILIAMYFYLQSGMDVWPPPGARLPGPTIPALCMSALVVACLGSYWASEAAKRNDPGGMIFGLAFNLFFGMIAMGFRAVIWRGFNFTWSADVHASTVWSIYFIHTFDVIADLIMTAALLVMIATGRHGPSQRLGVHVDSVLWYFLVAIWVPLWAVTQWGPSLRLGP